MKWSEKRLIIPKKILIHNDFFDEKGEILPGTYVIITADYVSSRKMLLDVRNWLEKQHPNKKWKRNGSLIECGEIRIGVYSILDPFKLVGLDNIKGYMIENGTPNAVEVGNFLDSRIRG